MPPELGETRPTRPTRPSEARIDSKSGDGAPTLRHVPPKESRTAEAVRWSTVALPNRITFGREGVESARWQPDPDPTVHYGDPTVPPTQRCGWGWSLLMCPKMGFGLSKRRSSQSSAGMRPDSLRRLRAHARCEQYARFTDLVKLQVQKSSVRQRCAPRKSIFEE